MEGRMNSVKYQGLGLWPTNKELKLEKDGFFQQDNNLKHTSKSATMKYLQERKIKVGMFTVTRFEYY